MISAETDFVHGNCIYVPAAVDRAEAIAAKWDPQSAIAPTESSRKMTARAMANEEEMPTICGGKKRI